MAYGMWVVEWEDDDVLGGRERREGIVRDAVVLLLRSHAWCLAVYGLTEDSLGKINIF